MTTREKSGQRPSINQGLKVIVKPENTANTVEGLAKQMGLTMWSRNKLLSGIRNVAKVYFALDRSLYNQKSVAVERCINKCRKLPGMEKYQNGWPIKPYLTMYLNHGKTYYERMSREYIRHRRPTMKMEVLVPIGHPIRSKRRQANDHGEVVSAQRHPHPPSLHFPGNTPPLRKTTSGSKEDVLQFLRNLIPSQETLILAFLGAGVESQGYLRSLAHSCNLRKAFLEKLQADKQITFIQSNILDEGLQRLIY